MYGSPKTQDYICPSPFISTLMNSCFIRVGNTALLSTATQTLWIYIRRPKIEYCVHIVISLQYKVFAHIIHNRNKRYYNYFRWNVFNMHLILNERCYLLFRNSESSSSVSLNILVLFEQITLFDSDTLVLENTVNSMNELMAKFDSIYNRICRYTLFYISDGMNLDVWGSRVDCYGDGDEFLTATDIGNTKMMLKAWIMSVSSHVLVINGDLFTKRYGV